MRVGSLARAAAADPAVDAPALGWLFTAILAVEDGRAPEPPAPPPALAAAWPGIEAQQRALHDAAEATRKVRAAAGRIGGKRKAANARKSALALASARDTPTRTYARAEYAGSQRDEYHTERGGIGGVYSIGGLGGKESEGETGGTSLANARAFPVDNSAPMLPPVTDYAQIFDIAVAPAEVAIAVTREPATDFARNTYARFARRLGELRFRKLVAAFWGEARQGEHAADANPAAVLVARLEHAANP